MEDFVVIDDKNIINIKNITDIELTHTRNNIIVTLNGGKKYKLSLSRYFEIFPHGLKDLIRPILLAYVSAELDKVKIERMKYIGKKELMNVIPYSGIVNDNVKLLESLIRLEEGNI